ncbi:IS91 family transposase [Noviherbaspirillum sedimenti]|uniref:Transposase n=1 Tax=Noviherbaspirillum sedimenti TaxID=2320865 RepID=A0A3A3GEX6_9BURK|nr:transposase [Noviherbaspirillum sedimenti]RJG00806.1 transposase [Noviherbaspirillum sedimenti]
MMRLADVIAAFEDDFLQAHGQHLLPSQKSALTAFKTCRTALRAHMQVRCDACQETQYLPHSCGHRHCPHCQAHESQRWIERQQAKQLPCDYFMLTFTLPAQWRPLVWQRQGLLYDALIKCAWETVNTFARNDRQLQGHAGAVAVLHTHNRRLDFHPHVHLVMPAGAINVQDKRWRTKKGKYLFAGKALARVFRARMLEAVARAGLRVPPQTPKEWVAHCKQVGSGAKAIAYLGRYLYRGVIQEKDILQAGRNSVTFRYRDSKSGKWATRTVAGVEFLRLVLQHVLPKGFRRARNFGFLHPNSKRLLGLLQVVLRVRFTPAPPTPRPAWICACCGGIKTVVRTRIDRCPMVEGTPIRDGVDGNRGCAM